MKDEIRIAVKIYGVPAKDIQWIMNRYGQNTATSTIRIMATELRRRLEDEDREKSEFHKRIKELDKKP